MTTFLKKIAARVGGFGLVLEPMRKRRFDNFSWKTRRLSGPVPE
jgi:hypothetical protein